MRKISNLVENKGTNLVTTRNLTLERFHSPLPLRKWSTIRPGVATTTWGRLPNSRACAIMSIPPTIIAVRIFNEEPNTANCSEIWKASSLLIIEHVRTKEGWDGSKMYLVGVKMRANIPYGSTESCCRMGNANAMVFPEPVLAFPMQSLPSIQVSIHEDSSDRSHTDSPDRRGGIQAA